MMDTKQVNDALDDGVKVNCGKVGDLSAKMKVCSDKSVAEKRRVPSDSRIYVCDKCIEDPDLQEVVRKHLISEECDYCGRRDASPIACELSDVLERIRFAVNQHYTDPANFVYWNGREGGWQGHPVFNCWELFEDIGWQVSNELLMKDIVETFIDEEFADEDYWPGPLHERLMLSWERFKQIVKHERRYTFWNVDDDPVLGIAQTKPAEMLNMIAEAIRFVALTKVFPPGARFWRVRVHKRNESLSRADDFSSPPVDKAVYPNRMSPSGIPMFYGSDDLDTAIQETVDPAEMTGKRITGAAFRSAVPLNILDLTAIPPQVGFFSDWTRDVRQAVQFLRAFATDISQPIKKDGAHHTEYVPTQVFTEFIRYRMQTPTGEPFQGIKYPSSQNGKGCYVLFLGQEECLSTRKEEGRPQVLRFVRNSARTVRWRKPPGICGHRADQQCPRRRKGQLCESRRSVSQCEGGHRQKGRGSK